MTDWDAKILRSHIGDLQRQKADIERQIEWTIQNLRKNCPHEDTTQVTSLMILTAAVKQRVIEEEKEARELQMILIEEQKKGRRGG